MTNLLKQLSRSLTIFLFFMLSGCFMVYAQKANPSIPPAGSSTVTTTIGKISNCRGLRAAPDYYYSCMEVSFLKIKFPSNITTSDVESITFKLSFSYDNKLFSLKGAQFNIEASSSGIPSWGNSVTLIDNTIAMIELIPNNSSNRETEEDLSDLITAIMGITGIEYDGDLCDGNSLQNLNIYLEDINVYLRTEGEPSITDEVLERSLLNYCSNLDEAPKTQGSPSIPSSSGIQITPNPAKEHCLLTVNPDKKIQQIALYNTTGQCMFKTENTNHQGLELDIKHLERGVYLLRIQTQDGIETRKLFLQ